MEVGLIIRYGKMVPGREGQALDLFEESSRYFVKKLSEGVLTFFEPFFFSTTDLERETGFFILKGPAPEIFKLIEEEEYRRLMQKGLMLIEHLQADLLTVGEGVPIQVDLARKVRAELGI